MTTKINVSYSGDEIETWVSDLIVGHYVALDWTVEDGPIWLAPTEAHALAEALIQQADEAVRQAQS